MEIVLSNIRYLIKFKKIQVLQNKISNELSKYLELTLKCIPLKYLFLLKQSRKYANFYIILLKVPNM